MTACISCSNGSSNSSSSRGGSGDSSVSSSSNQQTSADYNIVTVLVLSIYYNTVGFRMLWPLDTINYSIIEYFIR